MSTNTIGYRIKTLRESLEMSQDELAKRLGYKSRSSIAKIEKDGRELPQKKIAAIAKVLNTTPGYIMGWREEIKENPVGMAELYADIMMDKDFVELYEDFKRLDENEKQMVKKIVRGMANDEH